MYSILLPPTLWCKIALSIGVLVLTINLAWSDSSKSTFTAAQHLHQIDAAVRRGRIMMHTDQPGNALTLLRSTAADALKVLFTLSKNPQILTSKDGIPTDGMIGKAAQSASEAHYWWGQAALQINSRDEAITAFARAARLGADKQTLLSLKITNALNQSLENGFPQQAALDVLLSIAASAQDHSWNLKQATWEVPAILNGSKSTFMWTQGHLSAPNKLPLTAPLYRNVPKQLLPKELRSTQILYIYSIPSSVYHSGLAQLQTIVRFSNPKDAPLAAHLAQMMVKIKLSNDAFLKQSSPPLTLWLETVAASWPNSPGENDPWKAAAKIDSAPHDIMVFRIDKPRTDSEWMRELLHEQGHVFWPDFKTFAPPLEPNANGSLAEKLGQIWMKSNLSSKDNSLKIVSSLKASSTLPALQVWLKTGTQSSLATASNSDALHYLQGLCVYIDRVYGSPLLSHIMVNLKGKNNTAHDILSQFLTLLNQTKKVSIYLPATIMNTAPSASTLIHQQSFALLTDTNYQLRIYIPPHFDQLIIPWQGAGTLSSKSTFGSASQQQQQLTIDLNGTSGWQILQLEAEREVMIDKAVFH